MPRSAGKVKEVQENLKVLLIEDSVTAQQMVKRMLQADSQMQYHITACANLTDALSYIDNESIDVVILDLTLPESSGVQTVTRVREVDGEVPVVVFTGCDDENLAMAAMHLGADEYLVKREVQQGSLLARTLRYTVEKKRARLALDRYALEMERLAEERARQLLHQDRLATIGTMSAGIAHEIKNPLAYMATNVQTLKASWPDLEGCLEHGLAQGFGDEEELRFLRDEMPSILEEMGNGVQCIVSISDGLMAFARKSATQPEPTDLEQLVENALLLCHNLLKYGIEIHRDFNLDGRLIPLQGQKVLQVFVNLINNAAQAMAGRGVLTVGTSLVDDKVVATVGDTGPGIPDETLDSIWKPFFTTKEAGEGTGLGLSICKEIVEQHGGNVMASNNPEGGACFTLELPLLSPEPVGSQAPACASALVS